MTKLRKMFNFKIAVALAVTFAMLTVFTGTAQARPLMPGDPEVRIIKFQIGSKQYTVQDGTGPVKTVEMDVAPYTKKVGTGLRVMLPARFVVEAMGGRAEYNEKTKEVMLCRASKGSTGIIGESIKLHFFPGKAEMTWCCRVPMQLDTPIEVVNGRTFAPLRAVAQGMGGLVFWDSQTQTVTIETPNKVFTPIFKGKSDVPGYAYYSIKREVHTKDSNKVLTNRLDPEERYTFTLTRPVIVTSPGNPKLCSVDVLQELVLIGECPFDTWDDHVLIDPARKGFMIFQNSLRPFVQIYQKADGTGSFWMGPTEVYTQQKQNSYFDKKVYFTPAHRVLTDLTGFDMVQANYDKRATVQSFNGKTLVAVSETAF